MKWLYIWNSIGLVIEFTGFLILFRFGIPNRVNKEWDNIENWETPNLKVSPKWKKYKKITNIALVLAIVGFLLQLTVSITWIFLS